LHDIAGNGKNRLIPAYATGIAMRGVDKTDARAQNWVNIVKMVILTLNFHLKEYTMPKVSVAEAKSHLSELIAKSAHGGERFVITRRNRPVAALVSLEDLQIIEQQQQRQGLAAVAGKWKGFDELAEAMGDLAELRQAGGGGRDVSF